MTKTGAFYRGQEIQNLHLEVDNMTRDDIREYLQANFIPNTNYKLSVETAAGWRSGPIFSNPEDIAFPSLVDSDFPEDWEETNHIIIYYWGNNTQSQSQSKASKKLEPVQAQAQEPDLATQRGQCG